MKPRKFKPWQAVGALGLVVVPIVCAKQMKEEPLTAQHEAAVAYFKSESEPAVKDATWTSAKRFTVAVTNDGTARNGYAKYVCEMLYDYGFKSKGVRVLVVDMASVRNKETWRQLGSANCL